MGYSFKSYTLPKDYFKSRMVASELRLGNWIESYIMWIGGLPDDVPEVKHIRFLQVDIEILKMIEKDPLLVTMRPIPLTPELLEQCGFERTYKDTDDDWWKHPNISFMTSYYLPYKNFPSAYCFTQKNKEFPEETAHYTECKYLHQMQNLIFVLTGKELEIKL